MYRPYRGTPAGQRPAPLRPVDAEHDVSGKSLQQAHRLPADNCRRADVAPSSLSLSSPPALGGPPAAGSPSSARGLPQGGRGGQSWSTPRVVQAPGLCGSLGSPAKSVPAPRPQAALSRAQRPHIRPQVSSPTSPTSPLCFQEGTRRGAGAAPRRAQSPDMGTSGPLSPPLSPLQGSQGKYPLLPLPHGSCAPPAAVALSPSQSGERHTPGRFEWEAMEAFEFGEPPSPTSRVRISSCAPALGTVMRAPKDPADQLTERVLPRFRELVTQLIKLTGDSHASRHGDLLPHLSISEVVRQVVKRINWFSDTGAARTPDFRPVWQGFCSLMGTIFGGGRFGRDVKQGALTDLLGCVFDVELMPDAVPVAAADVARTRSAVLGHSEPTACICSLLSMLRHQHTESAHLNDTRSVGMVVSALLQCCRRAGEVGDPTQLVKEMQRFCDYPDPVTGIDLWTRLCNDGYSLGDPPLGPRPSPLGALRALARSLSGACPQHLLATAINVQEAGSRSPRMAQLFADEGCGSLGHRSSSGSAGVSLGSPDSTRARQPLQRPAEGSVSTGSLQWRAQPSQPLQYVHAGQLPSCIAAPGLQRGHSASPQHDTGPPPAATYVSPSLCSGLGVLSPVSTASSPGSAGRSDPAAHSALSPQQSSSDWSSQRAKAQQRLDWYDAQAAIQRRAVCAPQLRHAPPPSLSQPQYQHQSLAQTA
eukprot:TRINITY_DN6213_c0_g1_i1.p1 TRINITY_DN6213_c0_g1~~TRINITY_DN6213_c0_g1_i1.p1  ORF type:complete len:703 (+),score=146.15 TRINITY_DN6213_c0_g1_i1:149-2257(+)